MSMESTLQSPSSTSPGENVSSTVADRVLGVVGAAMILLAVVLFFVGGESDGTPAVASDAPVLELVQPRHGADVRTERLHVVFRVDGAMGPMPGGWGTESLHLHLALNGMELMPSPGDIERMPDGLYRWTLARPAPGHHTLRLLWSDAAHRPVEGGASRTVQIRVE